MLDFHYNCIYGSKAISPTEAHPSLSMITYHQGSLVTTTYFQLHENEFSVIRAFIHNYWIYQFETHWTPSERNDMSKSIRSSRDSQILWISMPPRLRHSQNEYQFLIWLSWKLTALIYGVNTLLGPWTIFSLIREESFHIMIDWSLRKQFNP